MLGFDIILGMYWLSTYGASFDCRKEFMLRTHGFEEFKLCGPCVRATPPLLFAVQARKSVREGAQEYLAYVLTKLEVGLKFEDIPIVRYYPYVFTKATGLPLDHEIQFTLELVSRTQPIYKAPYRMDPIELR